MFKKLLLKSVVGATAVGSALTVSLVATPAVTSAPQIQAVGYPAGISTTTRVSVSPPMAIYGQSATATAKVTASRTPRGQVHFVLSRAGHSIKTWTVTLRGGQASVALPRLAARTTYTVSARYWHAAGSPFINSGDSAYYTVKPAGTHTGVNAPDVWALDNAHATAVVSSPSPVGVTGKVRFTVFRNGHQITSVTRGLSGERASASFGKLPVGRYTVTAAYLGTRNFTRSSGSDAFRVTK